MKKRVTIYGIPNCDTMKKAFDWLGEQGIAYNFHDYKTQGISSEKLEEWLEQLPLSSLVNLKSSTYRNLSEADKASVSNKAKAIKLMMQQTSLIKRPVLETGKKVLLGFKAEEWEVSLREPQSDKR